MLSSFMHDDFFFDPFDHRMHRHNTRSFLQQPVFQGFIDDFDMSGPFRESSKTADEDPQQQGPCFSALSFSQVTTQDHTGSGVQETRREFSDSKGQFKREQDQAVFRDARRVAGKNRVERKLFRQTNDSGVELQEYPEVVTIQGVENTEAFDKIWGNMDRNIHLEGGSGKHAIENDKKHALDVPLQKDLSVTKAQLEADQAVKQAERTLKMARRAQREAKKNAEKSACAN